jgi:hypothetical protein
LSKFERTTLTDNEIAAKWAMFGPPPVLSSENKEGYYKLRNAFVRYFRPTDTRHWSWLRELVDTQWEIHRHLRNRTAVIERHDPCWRDNQCKTIIQHLRQGKEEARELSPQLSEYEILNENMSRIASRIAMAERLLLELGEPNTKDTLAYETAAKHVEKADKWLKNATQRRNTLLKILEYYCRPRDRAAEIPAAHYSELKQDELKHITASPFVPAASPSGHLITEDHLETVASTTEVAATDRTSARK